MTIFEFLSNAICHNTLPRIEDALDKTYEELNDLYTNGLDLTVCDTEVRLGLLTKAQILTNAAISMRILATRDDADAAVPAYHVMRIRRANRFI